ncbi:4-coumarate--CoA ligase [Aquincola tertiaricarbonis]|uniref:4-coumarate--CoA ligase n=1 Tax=Aquincola tertiaricarbonis TaxID=391953 RepID=UPI0018DCACF2|nr:4-coumarate--CoA ligase [Aquincola tertiaricarbonis]
MLERFVADLICDELKQLRPGGAALPERPWSADMALDEAGLGMDSLEFLAVASALSECLHLHESGLEDLLLARRRFGEWLDLVSDSLLAFDAGLTFRTSGSTGAAKPCCHSLASLHQEVEYLATLTPGVRRVLTAVPAHHIYGFLFTVLLPAQLDCDEVIDIRRQTPQSLASLLKPGDLVVSHPAHWALVERHAGRLPAGVLGASSTAPCPDELALSLKAQGLERLIQIYGSSETAGIATRDCAGAPYRLMPFWATHPHESNKLLRTTTSGQEDAHDVRDLLEWLGRDLFRVMGRLDEAVQVAGTNVFPAQVRTVLCSHPRVADAAVRLMTPAEGNRLKAFVLPVPGADLETLRDELWSWTQKRLPVPARPKAFSFGSSIPRTALGKLADWPATVGAPA